MNLLWESWTTELYWICQSKVLFSFGPYIFRQNLSKTSNYYGSITIHKMKKYILINFVVEKCNWLLWECMEKNAEILTKVAAPFPSLHPMLSKCCSRICFRTRIKKAIWSLITQPPKDKRLYPPWILVLQWMHGWHLNAIGFRDRIGCNYV